MKKYICLCLAFLALTQPVFGEILRKPNKQLVYRKQYKKLVNEWNKEQDPIKRKAIEEKIERLKKRNAKHFK
jgi:hypothetical protein